jgi:hypothetical protein
MASVFDGDGYRYRLGSLYLRLDDIEGAINTFRWLDVATTNGAREPFHLLAWTLALFRNGEVKDAERMLLKTMLSNTYLLPTLFGEDPKELAGWRGMWGDKNYVTNSPEWLLRLWKIPEITWARSIYYGNLSAQINERFMTIRLIMRLERNIYRLGTLLDEASKLERGDYSSLGN